MAKLNLLGLLPAYDGGGAEKVMLTYLQNNKSEFIDFSLFVSNASGPFKGKKINSSLDYNFKRFLYCIPKLLLVIKKYKINILFSTFPHISVILILLKLVRLHRCVVVVRQPNEIKKSLSGSIKYILLRALYISLIHRSDLLIVTSTFMKNEINILNNKIKNIKLIRNPVPFKNIRKRVLPVATNKDKIRLIYVGRLAYQKGVDIILNIIRYTNNLELLVLGKGSELLNLKKIVKEKKIENKIKFMGFVNKPNNLIAGSDYFILPSRWEGLPNSALESLTLGTPVITFDRVNGLKDLKNKTVKDSIIFCSNEEDMKRKINLLNKRIDFKNPKLRKNLLTEFNTPEQYQAKLNNAILKLNEKK